VVLHGGELVLHVVVGHLHRGHQLIHRLCQPAHRRVHEDRVDKAEQRYKTRANLGTEGEREGERVDDTHKLYQSTIR
jgi:hypothetical protein